LEKKIFLPSNNKKEANESMKEKLRALETSKNHYEMVKKITEIFVGEIVSWKGKNMAEFKVFTSRLCL